MKREKIAVVGTGYVGLPLAVLAQEKGWHVTGYDINAERIKAIANKECPWKDDALDADLKRFPIEASTDPSSVEGSSIVIITVPTPVTGDNLPDLRPLKQALTDIAPYLVPNTLLIVESTIDPGTMDEVVIPLLQEKTTLKPDAIDGESTIFVVHCPERINPGDSQWTIRNIPRVVGGYSLVGTQRAKEFYESILEASVMVMNTVTEAESVKILENTFRDINIAFVNEMAQSFAKLGIDITNVIKGASTKPFAFMPHYPGNGVGGHCISVDPYYMIERGRQVGFNHHFLRLARKINDSMPYYTVSLLQKALTEAGISPDKAVIALLGMAYKKNISDMRNSPAIAIRDELQKQGFTVRVFDPYILEASTVTTLDEALRDANVVMLATDHDVLCDALKAESLAKTSVRIVIDGKNALPPETFASHHIVYYGIGRQGSVSKK